LPAPLRIAHITDLHCNGSPEWKEHFTLVKRCLLNQKPHIIVITGDSVDHPYNSNFTMLATMIDDLVESLDRTEDGDKIKPFIVHIPGNHDYSLFGNKLFNVNVYKRRYNHWLPKIIYPQGKLDDVIDAIFRRYHVALFPLDSNASKLSFSFARGKVNAPYDVMQERDSHFNTLASEQRIDYQECLKIILLHHHLLPLGDSLKEELIDPFLTLANANQIFDAAHSINSNIILHGHKHISSIVRYKSYGVKKSSITISSCASSANIQESHREIKLLSINDTGELSIQRFHSNRGSMDFTLSLEPEELLVDYGGIRKAKHLQAHLQPNHERCPVESVRSKTKIVRIREDGSADIDLSLEDIKWKSEGAPNEKKIWERFRADTGRILGGQYEFRTTPLWRTIGHMDWANPLVGKPEYASPEQVEDFIWEFKPDSPNSTSHWCKIGYPLLNGYTLTKREHKEAYANWPRSLLRQEASSIENNYPTELLELIIKFPNKDLFPEPQSIDIRAYDRATTEIEGNLEILTDQRPNHINESNFVKRMNGLRIRPETREISLFVKHPQPHFTYTIRWEVPDCKQEAQLTERQKRVAARLTAELRKDPIPESVELFYNDIVRSIGVDALDDDSLLFFLLCYESDSHLLKACMMPNGYTRSSNLLIGRGPAGMAFKTRRVFLWELSKALKDDKGKPKYPVENVIEDLEPITVIALPLMYPKVHGSEWSQVAETDKKGICPAFGVLSIVSTKEGSILQEICDSGERKKKDHLTSIYGLIGDAFTKRFSGIY